MVCVSYVPDLNGDGRLDAVATDPTFGTAYVVLQTGPRTFAASPLLSSSAPQTPSIGDLNGDGRPDVAISWTDDADSPPDSPMNQNVVQHIDEFEELAVPFKDLWRSIILRAGWFECEGEPRPLVISIKFSADKLPLKKPAVLPAVGPFKVAWEALESIASISS